MFGHRHQVVHARGDTLKLAAFFWRMQRPKIDGLNTWTGCRTVQRTGFKVALSGLGGDEALGGYRRFQLLHTLRPLRGFDQMPKIARRGLERGLCLLPSWVPAKTRSSWHPVFPFGLEPR